MGVAPAPQADRYPVILAVGQSSTYCLMKEISLHDTDSCLSKAKASVGYIARVSQCSELDCCCDIPVLLISVIQMQGL